jgi:predicted MFS family arabinose efflux permease
LFKKILPLNLIIFLRFFGIFLVLPLISVYASGLENATPILVGFVVGGYALTQAFLQVPFGIWSDRIGRKKVIVFGLIIFLIGSIVSYFATDIYTLILGRFLQGAGAIGSVVSASVSDVVREEERGKAMAIIGASIALSFAFSMIFGSIFGGYFGVDFLFLITAFFSIIALYITRKIPNNGKIEVQYPKHGTEISFFKREEVLYLFISSFFQKGVMAITFLIIPILLTQSFGWEKSELWKLYIPAMAIGLLSMPISIKVGEKGGNPKLVFIISATLFLVVSGILSFSNSEMFVILALLIFFPAFNLIEPLIQSMVTKFVRADEKGKALGYTNSFAYFGTFFGGVGAGLFLTFGTVTQLGYLLIVLSASWLFWTLRISNPIPKGNLYLKHSHYLQQKLERGDFEFVSEWYLNVSESLLVVKYDKRNWKEEELLEKIR